MRIKFEQKNERVTRRAGLVLINEFGKRINLGEKVDQVFGPPGSNSGLPASLYVESVVEMLIDGALHLEDLRSLTCDAAYNELIERTKYPSSDALGNWLRVQGERGGEEKLWRVMDPVITLTKGSDWTVDIDATIIESDKGDAKYTYKEGIRGYQPLVGIIAENGLVVGSRFQEGNTSPQADLQSFIAQCVRNSGGRIRHVRSDSAGYNHMVINYCEENALTFTITADQDVAVKAVIRNIAESEWKQGKTENGEDAMWEVAETVHVMGETPKAFRLVVKRTKQTHQLDLFSPGYTYWVVATNLSEEQYDANAVILFHQKRGEMERLLGEIKNHFNLEHLPCRQFVANGMYFTLGVMAYNIVQLIKQIGLGEEWMKRSIRTLRYQLLHIAARVITHARYLFVRMVCVPEWFDLFEKAYLKIRNAPLAPA